MFRFGVHLASSADAVLKAQLAGPSSIRVLSHPPETRYTLGWITHYVRHPSNSIRSTSQNRLLDNQSSRNHQAAGLAKARASACRFRFVKRQDQFSERILHAVYSLRNPWLQTTSKADQTSLFSYPAAPFRLNHPVTSSGLPTTLCLRPSRQASSVTFSTRGKWANRRCACGRWPVWSRQEPERRSSI